MILNRFANGPLIRSLTVVLALSACPACYRIASPPRLGEPVQVRVVRNDSRLPRTQVVLHEAVAAAVSQRLGWRVAVDGSARLDLSISTERIRPAASDDRDVTNRWSIRIEGDALLVSRRGNLDHHFSGTGWYGALSDEPEGVSQAAQAAADDLAAWLEGAGAGWK
ncbi:hypothetical protein LBMAG53_17300 [Planctomycetota bacterium]|nr:hypothetical protein LBMAG53_17300 [Planctomycetota bacterium]